MSTIRASVIGNSFGDVPMDTVVRNAVQAYCHWGMKGTAAIDADYNFSSLTDDGTGNPRLDFTNNMADRYYMEGVSSPPGISAASSIVQASPKWGGVAYRSDDTKTTSQCEYQQCNCANGLGLDGDSTSNFAAGYLA